MAVSYRDSVIALLGILEREGGYRDPRDQVSIAQARTLVAINGQPITTVVCNLPLCPSRLELAGDLSPAQAATAAEDMGWWTDGVRHVCTSHNGGS